MKKYTGTIILGFICLGFAYLSSIFGVDTILSLGENATISEWVNNWIKDNPTENTSILIGAGALSISGIIYLIYHFITFKPKNK